MTPPFPTWNAWTATAQDAACCALAFASVVPPLFKQKCALYAIKWLSGETCSPYYLLNS
jgi:hypothetical protein